jgi:TIGR03009 family protein
MKWTVMFRVLSAAKWLGACLLTIATFVVSVEGQTPAPAGQPMGPRQAKRSPAPRASGAAPRSFSHAPFRLTAQQQDHLDRVLKYWEYKSSQVKTYQCRFTRYEYDVVFGPKDPSVAKAISDGTIRYAAPDKGQFHVETVRHYRAPQAAGEKPTYVAAAGDIGEHWISDGKSIYEFKAKTKQLIETQLPPHLQGSAITDGPLPFLFGAKAEKLKQRYWIREQVPPAGATQYWLEAYPRTRQDAANFQRVEVILDESFLPIALQLYPPNYDPKTNPSRTSYRFDERQVNNLVDQVQGFMNSFVSPRLPAGWTRHVEAYGDVSDSARVEPPAAARNQARRPTQQLAR